MLEEYKDLLTVKDLKEITGYTSNTTIYEMLKNNNIKYFRNQNGKYLIFKNSFIDYLNDNCYNNDTQIGLPLTQ